MDKDLSNYQRWLEICRRFEQKYGMTSAEFLLKFESGKLGDSLDYFDWYAAKHGVDSQEAKRIPLD